MCAMGTNLDTLDVIMKELPDTMKLLTVANNVRYYVVI